MKINRDWKFGNGDIKRWRIPIYGKFLTNFIPQPRCLRRWYYRKSFDWCPHQSNHHWKCWLIFGSNKKLLEGERDLWTGFYRYGVNK